MKGLYLLQVRAITEACLAKSLVHSASDGPLSSHGMAVSHILSTPAASVLPGLIYLCRCVIGVCSRPRFNSCFGQVPAQLLSTI